MLKIKKLRASRIAQTKNQHEHIKTLDFNCFNYINRQLKTIKNGPDRNER